MLQVLVYRGENGFACEGVFDSWEKANEARTLLAEHFGEPSSRWLIFEKTLNEVSC